MNTILNYMMRQRKIIVNVGNMPAGGPSPKDRVAEVKELNRRGAVVLSAFGRLVNFPFWSR